ncbi:MAG: hypothetical protein Q7R78_02785 [bacterium]|nr:hypothetical protein [bacterium]
MQKTAKTFLLEAFSIYNKNKKILILILVSPLVLMFLSELGIKLVRGNSSPIMVILFVLLVLVYVTAIFLTILSQIATIDAIHKIDQNQPVDLKTQYKISLPLFSPFILLGIITALSAFGSIFLLITPLVYIAYSLAVFVLVIEGKRGLNAIIGSYSLVKGRMFDVFGKLFFLVFLSLLVYVVIGLITSPILNSYQGVALANAKTIISWVTQLIGLCLITPISYLYMFGMYKDLKLTASTVETDEKKLKTWLKAFICIAIIAIISIVIGIILLINSEFFKDFMISLNLKN